VLEQVRNTVFIKAFVAAAGRYPDAERRRFQVR
jgi:cation transport regulator ChaB